MNETFHQGNPRKTLGWGSVFTFLFYVSRVDCYTGNPPLLKAGPVYFPSYTPATNSIKRNEQNE